MRILLSNDDGIHAPGLKILYQVLKTRHEVVVSAPEAESSGISHALSLHKPLLAKEWEPGVFSVDGTPTDAVFTAFNYFFKDNQPQLVISGINPGHNLGHDVTYSGTVGAALEGTFFNRPAIAASMARPSKSHDDFAAAASVVLDFIDKIDFSTVGNMLMNLNIPNNVQEPFNYQVATLERGRMATCIVPTIDPRGKERLWIGGVPNDLPSSDGSDRQVLDRGLISVTALKMMDENPEQQKILQNWLN